MSYIKYPEKYPTLLKYKEAQNEFNQKLSYYLSLEDKYNKLVEKQITQAKWSIVPGSLDKVVANSEEHVWGYNSSNQVFTCKKPCIDGQWKQTDGSIKDIAADAGNVYGLGTDNTIYRKPANNQSNWESMKTPTFNKITTNDSHSIVAGKSSFNVSLRITIGCSGEKDTDDEGVDTKITNACMQYKGINLKCQGVNQNINNNTISFTTSFTTAKTRMDNVVITVNNGTHEIKHDAIADLFSGKKITFHNPFKKEHVSYPSISYLKIEVLQQDQNYLTIYESNLNIGTGSGSRNYSVSLGSGLVIGYNLYQCVKPCDGNQWQPISVDKEVQDISADESYIYMTDNNDILWRCSGGCTNGAWERDTMGSAKKVDASGSKYLRVIGSDNMLWERDKRKWNQPWTPTNKVIKNMSLSGTNDDFLASEDIEGKLWTITPNNNIEVGIRPPFQKWRSEEGLNATVGLENANKKSTKDWDFIGEFENYEGCKFASLRGKKPYNKITYFNDAYNSPNLKKTCWGNKIGGRFKNKQEENATTGYPPYGYTMLGGLEGFQLLVEMKKLNAELIARAKELKKMTVPNNSIHQNMLKQKTSIAKKMSTYVKNLENDRTQIRLLEKQNLELGAEKENSTLIMTQKQGAYVGITIAMIIILIITAKQFKK